VKRNWPIKAYHETLTGLGNLAKDALKRLVDALVAKQAWCSGGPVD